MRWRGSEPPEGGALADLNPAKVRQMPLSEDQKHRYERNIMIPGFGEAAQERLGASRVAIVGLGGLGSPAAMYLAAAGIGTLGLFDADQLELSNLQRQVIHATPDLGRQKVESAAEAIARLNPEVRTRALCLRLTESNAREALRDYDVVIEATDNFASKYVLNDACIDLGKPLAVAGILSLSGQAQFIVPGATPCLRCAVADIPEGVPTTSEEGVLGAVPGILGSVEALEVIRWLVGRWRPRPDGSGALHSVDGETMRLNTLWVRRRPTCRCAPLWSTP